MIASFTVAELEMNVGISPWAELTTLSDMFSFHGVVQNTFQSCLEVECKSQIACHNFN